MICINFKYEVTNCAFHLKQRSFVWFPTHVYSLGILVPWRSLWGRRRARINFLYSTFGRIHITKCLGLSSSYSVFWDLFLQKIWLLLLSYLKLCLPHHHGLLCHACSCLCHGPLESGEVTRLTQHPHLPGTIQVLALQGLCPRKSCIPGQTGMVGHWDIYALAEPLPRQHVKDSASTHSYARH